MTPTEYAVSDGIVKGGNASRVFAYTSDAAVIRAALPSMLTDPLYRASVYAPRQTLDLDHLTDHQLYNCIPTVLRWYGNAWKSRKADFKYRLDRLHGLHGPLSVAVVHLPPTLGSIYQKQTAESAARYASWTVDHEFSAVWKLERAGDGLHLHVTASAEALARSTLLLAHIETVYDMAGHANYMAKPSDAGLCPENHSRYPDPAEITRAVLEYVHIKSQGSPDRRDWDKVPSVTGWITGYQERRAADLGLISKKQSRPRDKTVTVHPPYANP